MHVSFASPALFVLAFLAFTTTVIPQVPSPHADCNLVLGSRIVYSSDYSASMREILNNRGGDVSGPGLFYGFDAGMDFRVFSSFYLHPNIRWIFSSVTSSERDERASSYELNSFFLPGVEAKMYFPITGNRFLYLGAGVSGASFSTKYQFEMVPKGVSETYMLGFMFTFTRYNVGMELGYQVIPMQFSRSRYEGYYYPPDRHDQDFGGIYFSVNANISLFDYHTVPLEEQPN